MTKLHEISLETFAGGAAPERFERELKRVLKNIMDRNTKPEAPRSIKLTFIFEPNESRTSITARLEAEAKLAPVKPVPTTVHVATRGDQYVAVGYDPRQPDLFPDAQDPDVAPVPEQEK